jgi:hypothetical protein
MRKLIYPLLLTFFALVVVPLLATAYTAWTHPRGEPWGLLCKDGSRHFACDWADREWSRNHK